MNLTLKTALCLIGFIWLLPVNLISWAFLCTLALFKQIEDVIFYDDFSIIWDVNNKSKFYKLMSGWYGFVLGSNIVCVDARPRIQYITYIKHETAHIYQQYIFGILFYPLYILMSLFIYFFMPSKLPYQDNLFEKWARSYAGQKVEIPEDKRREYLKDRWRWW